MVKHTNVTLTFGSRRHMLIEWRLHCFKSVQANTSLTLAPLTILTGPNSAGKSTVIQSIPDDRANAAQSSQQYAGYS